MLPRWLKPQAVITEPELERGLRAGTIDAVFTQIMGNLTSGTFLVAFALLLGASNLVIGLIAALQSFTQILQIPTIYLVEATRRRKALMFFSLFTGRSLWILMGLIPWLLPRPYQIPLLFLALTGYFSLGTVSGLAWNSWMRDLIPQNIMGSYMGKRMALATGVGAVLSLAAGFGADLFKKQFPTHPQTEIYSAYFIIGAVMGLISVYYLVRTPEPRMEDHPHPGILKAITEPFQDGNFRRLMVFLGSWNFAVNLAAPFFTVYMLKRLHLSMGVIIAFSVLSQMVNVMFFHLWGRLADRFSNKSVLAEAGPMFIATFLLWPFTDLFENPLLVFATLLVIHALAGMSTAGVTLCTGNIALKLAPAGKSTAYLAVRSLTAGIAATLAPILGGVLGNWFEGEKLVLTLQWVSQPLHGTWTIPTLQLQGLDFLFLMAFFLGLYALHRLLAVEEEGAVEKGVVLAEFNGEVRRAVRDVSNVAGLRDLLFFPYSHLLRLIGERRRRRRRAPEDERENPAA